MTDINAELLELQRRFAAWRMPAEVTEMQAQERALETLLSDAADFCRRVDGGDEELRTAVEGLVEKIARMYRAASSFPLPPNVQAVFDPAEGQAAGELANYLRQHGVRTTIKTLHRLVPSGLFSTTLVPSGIKVSGPASAPHLRHPHSRT